MIGIILAAGRGRRLMPLTENIPKPMVNLKNRPLIYYTIQQLLGTVDAVVIVGGYRADVLRHYIESNYSDFIFRENKDYSDGNITSIAVVRDIIEKSEGFILMNSDHIYPPGFISQVVKQADYVSAVCDRGRSLGPDDMKVDAKGNRLISISKGLQNYTHGYIGVTLVKKNGLSDYISSLDLILRKKNWKSYCAEDVLQNMADGGKNPYVLDVGRVEWYEIDSPEELRRAENEAGYI